VRQLVGVVARLVGVVVARLVGVFMCWRLRYKATGGSTGGMNTKL
jgi:hypothetical protein